MQITKVICIFDGIASNGITREDAHRKMYELGSRIDAEEQYPVEISAVCDLGGKKIPWTRSLHSQDGRTHISKAKLIMEYGSTLQKSVREGNKNTILPLIAYYGTGRLYMQKKLKKMLLKIQGFPERQAILIAWIQLLMINKCCSGLSR